MSDNLFDELNKIAGSEEVKKTDEVDETTAKLNKTDLNEVSGKVKEIT